MEANIIAALNMEYEKRRKQANDALEARKSAAFAKAPRLEEIESEIMLSGIKYNKDILLGDIPPDETADILLAKINSLKEERGRILGENGYSQDFLELSFRCPKCRDTGIVETTDGRHDRCSCYKQLMLNHLYNRANLQQAVNDSFNTFEEELYPAEINEKRYGIKNSPRDNILKIKRLCLEFIEKFNCQDTRNLYFCGPTGVGKTFIANCIAIELIQKGVTVLYQTAPVLFNIISENRLRSMREDDRQDSAYRYIMEVELLIIDDLGTESPSAARYADLLTILNARQSGSSAKPCKTIISTNIDVRALRDFYDERVVSRIIGGFDMFKFAGEDIRSLKKIQA